MNELTPNPEMPSATPEAAPMSLMSRMLNVLAAPGEVFESVKNAPTSVGNWLLPAVIFILVSWLGAALIFSQEPIKNQLRDMTAKGIEKQVAAGKITSEQAAKAQEGAEKMTVIAASIGAYVVAVLVGLGTIFWGGLIVWLGGRMFGGELAYTKAMEIAGLSLVVGIVGEVVRVLLVLVMGNMLVSPGLGLLVKDMDPQSPMFGVLAAFNVFLFWELAVRATGMARLGGASFGKAAVWVFGVWAGLTGVLMGIGFAARKAFGG